MEEEVIDKVQINAKKMARIPDPILERLDAGQGDIIVFIEGEERIEVDTAEVTV